MSQSRIGSFLESITNTTVGFGIGVISQVFLFPLYGIEIPISTNLKLAVWFTIIGIVRSYVLRRWFNKKTVESTG